MNKVLAWNERCCASSFVKPQFRCQRPNGHGPNLAFCAKHAEPIHQTSFNERIERENEDQRMYEDSRHD